MPTYMVTSPEGQKFRITAPEGATQEEVLSYAKDQFTAKQPAPSQPPSDVEDITRSVVQSGIPRGVAGLLGFPGDVANAGDKAGQYVGNKLRALSGKEPIDGAGASQAIPSPAALNSENVLSALEKISGQKTYEPQSRAGKYASTLSEFAVAPTKAIPASLAAGLLSESAGQATEGTRAESYARIGGALLGAGAAGGAAAARGTPAKELAKALESATPSQIEAAKSLKNDADKMGSPLTGAEALAQAMQGNDQLMGWQRFVESSPKGGAVIRPMMNARPEQNRKAFDKVNGVTVSDPTLLGADIQDSASNAINAVKRERSDATRELYKQADETKLTDATSFAELTSKIDQQIKNLGENNDASQILKQLRTRISGNMPHEKISESSILDAEGNPYKSSELVNQTPTPMMQTYKEQRDKFEQKSLMEGGVPSSIRGLGKPLVKELGVILEDKVPSLQEANALFAQISKQKVRPIEVGALGALSETGDITKQGQIILDTKSSTPFTIKRDVEALKKQSPDATQLLSRKTLEDHFDKATKNLQGGKNQAGAAKFVQSVVGSQRQEQNLRAFVDASTGDPNVYKGFRRMLDVMEAQGKRQPPRGQSQTQPNQAMAESMIGGVTRALRNPAGVIGEVLQGWKFGANSKKMADILTDPDSVSLLAEMARIGKYDPRGPIFVAAILSGTRAANEPSRNTSQSKKQ